MGEQTSSFLLPNSLWNSDHLENVEADKDEYGAGEVGLQHLVPLLAVPLLQQVSTLFPHFFLDKTLEKKQKVSSENKRYLHKQLGTFQFWLLNSGKLEQNVKSNKP